MIGQRAEAIAHPNIALAKYWGKLDEAQNLPAVPSLSLTLAGMSTRAAVQFDPALSADAVEIDGRPATAPAAARVAALLDLVWQAPGGPGGARPPAAVQSANDFPTAAGLASSASAFAALAVAASAAAGARWSEAELSDLARRISASAARSVFGGFVELPAATAVAPALSARPLAGPEHWDLRMIVAVTTEEAKTVGSTQGMLRTARTSPLYAGWLAVAPGIFAAVREAVLRRDLERLGEAAERSALAMHATALAAEPGLLYWNGATVELMAEVRRLRAGGLAAYFTIDAGPHVKVLTVPEEVDRVRDRLAVVPGVLRTIVARPGAGARLCSVAAQPGESP
ncbi:MAG: diphosphomevalonate decarboxylase [Deltaproteobacteria bacterium]|nr:diphosphomevalonate decarboxylase [Deltaproteobacteria bacterium]